MMLDSALYTAVLHQCHGYDWAARLPQLKRPHRIRLFLNRARDHPTSGADRGELYEAMLRSAR